MRKSLLRVLSWASDELNIDDMTLRVKASNARAIRLYESVGFRLRSGPIRTPATQQPQWKDSNEGLQSIMSLKLEERREAIL